MAGKTLFFTFVALSYANGLKLKQVLVFSRHSIRAPLNIDIVTHFTPNIWPEWETEVAHLTPRGAEIEEYMGSYFAEWLKKEDFSLEDCTNEDMVYVYANHKQRTEETARSFTKTAFKYCNVTIHFRDDVILDPVFSPVLRNTTEEFRNKSIEAFQKKLDELNLKDTYSELNRILRINESEICKTQYICNLNQAKDEIIFKVDEEPNLAGPLEISNMVLDNFLMSYYNGVPLEGIAWDEVITKESWRLLTEINRIYHHVRFTSPIIADDVTKPLLQYILKVFLDEKPKFTFLVGHDSIMKALMAALRFKPYELSDQDELTPIGSKLVFQKWYDELLKKDFLKIKYVYHSTEQVINGTELSLDNPPKIKVMEMKYCNVDSKGFCEWSDFLNFIKDVAN